MKALVLVLCFFTNCVAIAQQSLSSMPSSAPLRIVNGKVVNYDNFLKLLLPEDIKDINILNGVNASALYGSRAANGAIVISLKPSVKLLSFDKLLKKFRVKKSDRQYVAYIDNRPIQNTSEFYASPTWIKEIKLQKRNNGMAIIPYLNLVKNK